MPQSPRLSAVVHHADELLAVADRLGAGGVALCGSVARGTDHDSSDIDFYVADLADHEDLYFRVRAEELVRQYKRVLVPYSVDVRGLPGWPLGPEHEASMRADAVDLRGLRDGAPRPAWPAPGTARAADRASAEVTDGDCRN